MQRGEEFRRFWDEICGAGREDEDDKKGDEGELGRGPKERLRVVELDGRCESPVCVWWMVGGKEGKREVRVDFVRFEG